MEMKRDAEGLISALEDEDAFVRYRAEKAPDEIGDSRAVDSPIYVLEIKGFEKTQAATLEIAASRNMTALLRHQTRWSLKQKRQ
jgi:HEAT repeat protein